MRISELGRRAEVPPKTIRYYEQVGVLPAPRRSASGYRDYDADAVERLSFVKAAQSLGLTLGEIREILAFRDRGERPCIHVAALIEARARDLSERIATLQRMESDLKRLAKRARRLQPGSTGRYCHIIEAAALGAADKPALPVLPPVKRRPLGS